MLVSPGTVDHGFMSTEPSEQPASPADPSPVDEPRPVDPPPAAGGPLPPPPPQARQLVRNPYSKLGGVASGLSHHYGIDISLIRLAFVVFTFVSGFGLLVYLIAWLVIPRAKFWPPVGGSQQIRSLSVRELAIGLLVMGVVGGLFVNGGTFSGVLIPVILVGGGIWLLAQPAADPIAPPAATMPGGLHQAPGPTGYGQPGPAQSGYGQPGYPQPGQARSAQPGYGRPVQPQSAGWNPPSQPVDTVRSPAGGLPVGSPVPPRSRRGRVLIGGLIFGVVVVPILFIGAMIIAVGTGEFEVDGDFEAVYRPTTVAQIPETLDHDAGDITLDLSQLEASDFDEPLSIDFDLGFGDATIVVPDDLPVDIEASSGLGSVELFDNSSDGVDPRLSFEEDGAILELDLHVGFGSIWVERPETADS